METLRKQLTEIQFRHLLEAQMRLEKAKAELEAAKTHFNQISELIMDAVNLSVTNMETCVLEVNTRELVVTSNDDNE